MTILSGLSRRILWVTIACGLAGLIAASLITREVAREILIRNTLPVLDYLWRSSERAKCEASPETWTLSLVPGTGVWAYDPQTLRARNPAAPPLDSALASEVPHPGDRAMARTTLFQGGWTVHRTAAEGPCGLVVLRWTRRLTLLDATTILFVGGVLVSALAAAIGARIRDDARRLEERQADLRRHLDDVTHDLRTPIGSLQLALEQGADMAEAPALRELLHGALKDVVYLGALTANLRLASQLREGWSPSSPGKLVNLGDTATRVASRARIVARRSGISLDVAVPDEPVLVACDPVAAEQALGNVVDNAVAYGDPGGHVAVVLEREGAGFLLRVEDDGPGVAPSELPRLGERTFRSDEARQRDPRGSGLGLAITTEVCERCGWTLRFEPAAPRGLRVTIGSARSG